MNRREFIRKASIIGSVLAVTPACRWSADGFLSPKDREAIDRRALVTRHNINWPSLDGQIPLGNGNFAFNADGTGLQTVGGNTMSHWCWHNFPLPPGVTRDEIKPWATPDHGRLRGLTTRPPAPIFNWQRDNPQPLNLGRIGFINKEGERLSAAAVEVDARHLELWTGLLTSHFTYLGQSVAVQTCVDPERDTVAVRVESPLLRDGRLRVMLDFPAPALDVGGWVGNFSRVAGHETTIVRQTVARLELHRTIDDAQYDVVLNGRWFAARRPIGASPHQFILTPDAGINSIDFTCHFGTRAADAGVTEFESVKTGCAKAWPAFWNSGGAVDLSRSRDPRWKELERRIVLSQYELAVQSAGDNPPAECGLTGTDPWHAKWHFEMTWWHLAHYALWNRWAMAEKALTIYQRIRPVARAIAENFDYQGLMWPKSTGPDGSNDGWPPEMALIWREPHPIFFAELDYRLHPTKATLAQWKDIVFGTADFMADYPTWNKLTGHYDLYPVWPAYEGDNHTLRRNTIFELGYWHVALAWAQQWRLRLGLEREPHWDDVANRLAPLPAKDGLYIYSDDRPDTYTARNVDHLDMIGIAGMLPPFKGLDAATARRTVEEVGRKWNWDAVWGWDFPWLAMAAARVGDPKLAIEALLNLSGKNHYDERGICTGGPGPYLPGNGGLLYAVAMMAVGWDGAPIGKHAPGFPDDGNWVVKWEGLIRAP